MKKRFVFIHLGKLSDDAGHTARLRYLLPLLSRYSDVLIISLVSEEDLVSKITYPQASFTHIPISFSGWNVLGVETISKLIKKRTDEFGAELVILSIEIWDLIVSLNNIYKNQTPFCCICHAMPFLISPQEPTRNYSADVKAYLQMPIPKYRNEYISQHASELPAIMREGILVANNRAVEYYFKNYFPEGVFWMQDPFVTVGQKSNNRKRGFDFDFCYMARIEKGKGLEYLELILKATSKILGRQVRLAIMGRADDPESQAVLETLLGGTYDEFKIDFYGWADDPLKDQIFSRSACFLYPSVYDNFPTVVNEALAHGLPVVLWNTLFYRLNYFQVSSVKGIECFDFQKYAEAAVDFLNRSDSLSDHSFKFIEKMGKRDQLLDADMKLFLNIIHFHD